MDSSSQVMFERAGELKDQSTVAHSPKACQSCTALRSAGNSEQSLEHGCFLGFSLSMRQ